MEYGPFGDILSNSEPAAKNSEKPENSIRN